MNENVKIWSKFLGKRTKRNYWIQTATEEYYEDIIKYMTSEFILDEPVSRYCDLISCKESIESMKILYRALIKENSILLCLTTDDDNQKIGIPRIVAMNVTAPETKNNPELTPKGEKWTLVYNLIGYMAHKINAHETLNLDVYLSAMGLYVLPEFRGEGIGLELLKAREPLCRANGIKASCTVFTSIISQKIAEKAGFKDLVSVSYEDLFKERPDLFIPNLQEHTKNCRFMYIEYK